jgi:hypothetical protein
MKYIITIIKRIFSKELPKPTGRWKVEHCNKKMNSKIDLSNEDHCGPCGQYALSKLELKNSQNKDEINKDIYLEKQK